MGSVNTLLTSIFPFLLISLSNYSLQILATYTPEATERNIHIDNDCDDCDDDNYGDIRINDDLGMILL